MRGLHGQPHLLRIPKSTLVDSMAMQTSNLMSVQWPHAGQAQMMSALGRQPLKA